MTSTALLSASDIASAGGALISDLKPPLRFMGNNPATFTYENVAPSTSYLATTRITHVATEDVTRIALAMRNASFSGLDEAASTNSVIVRAAVEYNGKITPITVDGKDTWVVSKQALLYVTDTVGVRISKASPTFYLRITTRVPKPPVLPSAMASAGGALTSGTARYYKITTVDNGVESAASTEVNATPTSSNLSVTLAWTAPAYGDKIRVYAGPSTGTETFLAELPITATGYIDNGYTALTPGITPPSTQPVYAVTGNYLLNTEASNGDWGAQTDITYSTGDPTGPHAANTFGNVTRPFAVLTDGATIPSLVVQGDSIAAGTGIWPYQQSRQNNWVNAQVTGINILNAGFPSTKLTDLLNGSSVVSARLGIIQFATAILSEFGRNDIYRASGSTWYAHALNQLAFATQVKAQNKKFYLTTLLPGTQSTDGWTSMANQTIDHASDYNVDRVTYNTWVRAGSPVDSSGAPVSSGGTKSALVDGYFDAAAVVEANSAGTLTPNGGYWYVPSTATISGTVGTGSTISNLVTTGLTVNVLGGRMLKITSGAASGQFALTDTNTTTTALPLYISGVPSKTGINTNVGLSVAPSNGDAWSILPFSTVDGIHPNIIAYGSIATAFSAWVTAVIR